MAAAGVAAEAGTAIDAATDDRDDEGDGNIADEDEEEAVVDFPTWQQFFAGLQGTYERDDSTLSLRHLLGESHLSVVERVVCRTFAHW